MIKFVLLNKLKILLVFIILIKYSLLSVFFVLQGSIIEAAIAKSNTYKSLIYILLGYVIIKLIAMLCDIAQRFAIEHFKNIDLKLQWANFFPKKLFRDNENREGQIHILLFDYLPTLFDLESTILVNTWTFIFILFISISLFLYTGFYYGMASLLLIFALNYISKNVFLDNIAKQQKEINKTKSKVFLWINQFFRGYKELAKNWAGTDLDAWSVKIYHDYYINKRKHNFFYLYRDLLGQFLIELPFLVNTAIVVSGVYYGALSLTQMFIWVGISQFMINSSSSYLENRALKKRRHILVNQAAEIIREFKLSNIGSQCRVEAVSYTPIEIILRDGTRNILAANPGLYAINGANGSGKSTLLNVILGYERNFEICNNKKLHDLIKQIQYRNIRLIERDAVIFDNLNDFSAQVLGPAYNNQHTWEQVINCLLFKLFDDKLAKQWLAIFKDLELQYNQRKDKVLSSGEKIILSFMRCLSDWNFEVKLLIVDECHAFLDQYKKKLFKLSMEVLAVSIPVFISSHENNVIAFKRTNRENENKEHY